MPAAMRPTLAPGDSVREALAGHGAGSARAREALAAAAAAVNAERARAREAGLRRRFQLALNTQSQSIFASNQIHLRYKWLDGRMVGAWPTPRWEWVSGREAARAQYPLPRDPLQLPAFELPVRYHESPTPPNHFMRMDLHQGIPGGSRTAVSGSGVSAGSGGTSGAVGVGAAVLALAALVLLARAFERCLDQRLFKLLRRRSDEWVTPNVLATSNPVTDDAALESPPSLPPGDPPPPYAMCVLKRPPAPSIADPPPPYSACYVAFGGPQDPAPRVYLNGPTLNSFQDTGQPGTEQNRDDSDVSDAAGTTSGDTGGRDRDSDVPSAELRSSRDSVVAETAACIQIV